MADFSLRDFCAGGTKVMGILNVTPDSFSDGGNFERLPNAIDQAANMIAAGADMIDIGGESTRPGAQPVAAEQECERVVPVLEALSARFDIPLSIDTSKAAVMRAAVAAGAKIVNDVKALRDSGAVEAVVDLRVPVCLMHMQGEPRVMQQNPQYGDVVVEVLDFLLGRADVLIENGFPRDQIMLDPGIGFGKTLQHNLQLLEALNRFVATGFPALLGVSRKSLFGQLLDREVDQRLPGSLAVASLAAHQGVAVLRVHDVRETVDVVTVVKAIKRSRADAPTKIL